MPGVIVANFANTEDKKRGSGGCCRPPVGSRGNAPGGGQGAKPPEAEAFSKIESAKTALNAISSHKKYKKWTDPWSACCCCCCPNNKLWANPWLTRGQQIFTNLKKINCRSFLFHIYFGRLCLFLKTVQARDKNTLNKLIDIVIQTPQSKITMNKTHFQRCAHNIPETARIACSNLMAGTRREHGWS